MARVPDAGLLRPWLNEPDDLAFEASGLQCKIRRNGLKALCGYVGVPQGHPLYGKHYSDDVIPPPGLLERPVDIDKVGAINVLIHGLRKPEDEGYSLAILIDVHGGLTFSGRMEDDQSLWWFGFDCSHAGDLVPGMQLDSLFNTEVVYRDINYVTAECESLAKQLAEWPKDMESDGEKETR